MCCTAEGKTCDRLTFHLVGELRYSQIPHVTEFRNISIHVGHIAHVWKFEFEGNSWRGGERIHEQQSRPINFFPQGREGLQ